MNAAKTPAELAKIFGCTKAQAREQIIKSRSGLLEMLRHMRKNNLQKYRGYTDQKLSEHIQRYNVALSA